MNTERENLAAALLDVASGSRRNKTARLRECFDEIEAAKAAGASNKTIVATLEANGLFYDVPNLKNACSRIRKERALAALSQKSTSFEKMVPGIEPPIKVLKRSVPISKKSSEVQIQQTHDKESLQTEKNTAQSKNYISDENFKKVGDDIDLNDFT